MTNILIICLVLVTCLGALSNDKDCQEFYLKYLEKFDLSYDTSDECRDEECVVLEYHYYMDQPWQGFCPHQANRTRMANWICGGPKKELTHYKLKFSCLTDVHNCGDTIKCDKDKFFQKECLLEPEPYCPFMSQTTTEPATTRTTEPPKMTTTTTAPLPICDQGNCFSNECFFQDHCYFLYVFESDADLQDRRIVETTVANSCAKIHYSALGLAVESVPENNFVKNFAYDSTKTEGAVTFYTSGIKRRGQSGVWEGWDSHVDQSILGLPHSEHFYLEYYNLYKTKDQVKWYYQDSVARSFLGSTYVICERPATDSSVLPELQEKCRKLLLQSDCPNAQSCCAMDENGTLWFGCASEPALKDCFENEDQHMVWECNGNGFFRTEFPSTSNCECLKCQSSHDGIDFMGCADRYAIGKCPYNQKGYSKWYCAQDGTFEGTPDFTTCCPEPSKDMCQGYDPFLNLWISCPSTKGKKQTQCPPGRTLTTAEVEWKCDQNGHFVGDFPDYTNCDGPCKECRGSDKYGQDWEGCPNNRIEHRCPGDLDGNSFWFCNSLSQFENDQPDFSSCRPKWIDQIQDQVCL